MLDARDHVKVDLPSGRHQFIVMIDRAVRKQAPLKISLYDVGGSKGRAQVMGGL